ncbi:hypothetical protein FJZ31_38375 [Candidatus Poribacteria bacterium]|nr:hypothetical protein [Candidatus Poribacteria bacterium]
MLTTTAKSPKREFVLKDKTLVAWVIPANLTQRGGSVLTLDDCASHFDGIIFGEIAEGKWMAGSDSFRRSQQDQSDWPGETVASQTLVQMAIVYNSNQITLYRNGETYAQYNISEAQTFGPDSVAVMGLRHLLAGDRACFAGAIEDARIYDVALTQAQIVTLGPNQPSEPEPLTWWTFEDGKVVDLMGHFTECLLVGNARVAEGRLYLDGKGSLMVAAPQNAAMKWFTQPTAQQDSLIDSTRQFRARLLSDPYRPTYHFVTPEGLCMPFDPNGAIFWNGRYHLGYIYQDKGVHFWGHVSSRDLLHWRHHPPSLFPTPDSPETGIFSGNCFINKKGEATMLYHGCGVGNCIATSADKNLDFWKKLPANPIIPNPPAGAPYASWDPHGWLEGETYYAIFGGKRPAIFKATELDKWEYVGDLLAHAVEGVDINEDVSCPDLFKLGNKYLLVCISHRLGCRYYIGEWKNEQFYPEFHEQMSWVDNAFFAPESMEDNKGRRILWTWIFDGPDITSRTAGSWSGTMSLPRVLWLVEDNKLRMRPVEELELLRYNEQTLENMTVKADSEQALETIQGNTIELLIEMVPDGAKQCGVKVCCSPDGEEQTLVYYDASERKLKIDTRQSSLGEGLKSVEGGPFELKPGEILQLQVFVDKSVVEVFANDRQAVMRRIYPKREDSVGVTLFSNGGATLVKKVKAWDMMPSNPY